MTLSDREAQGERFRDSVSIVATSGKRRWIYPRKPHGFFTRLRAGLAALLLVVLFVTPFLRLGGQPLMLFDIPARKFILFGVVFGPHDYYLLGLALITLIVSLILFTAAFGRLFCGWVCPQTVLMEMVFRRIDYWIEGDHREQKKLDASPWTGRKIVRKGSKYAVYLALSLLISHTLLAYILGSERVLALVTDAPTHHAAGFTAMLVFTLVFYWIFAWFREQACILICPYGRLQGVLLDRNSIVIAYDTVRGEPRGKLRRGADRSPGDCIDCGRCVEVCPTGIDIRNGTQLECVNCTACIDACDAVMESIDRPKRLIRYDSANGIATKERKVWTGRVIGYSAVLTVLLGVLAFSLVTRSDVDVTILRTPGMFYQEQPDGRISNVYDVTVLNKTFSPVPVVLELAGGGGELRLMGGPPVAGPQQVAEAKMLLVLERTRITGLTTPLEIHVLRDGKVVATVHTSFLGPALR